MAGSEEAVWEALPEDEHQSVWDETERNFWSNFKKNQDNEYEIAEREYQQVSTEIKNLLRDQTARRAQIAETQARLAREAAKADEEMALVSNEFNETSDRQARVDQDRRKAVQAGLETRQNIIKTMRRFFREKRGGDPNAEDPEDLELDAIIASVTNGVNGGSVNGTASLGDDSALNGTGMDGIEYQLSSSSAEKIEKPTPETIVDVVDADGQRIGPVQRIEPWNQWVDAILDLPILRAVKIRRGRRFNESHLATIYERSEAKGVKWLSCLIQATGAVQRKRCQSCEKNQGAFDDCVIVGGDLFQKCGNCEWNRQGCHGASGDVIDFAGHRRRSRESRQLRQSQQGREYQEPPREALRELQPAPEPRSIGPLHASIPPPVPNGPFAPGPERSPVTPAHSRQPVPGSRPIQADTIHPSTEIDSAMKDTPMSHDGRSFHEPEQMPTPQEYRVTPGFTPANTRSRPPSADRPTPTSIPIEPSPQPTEMEPEEPLEEITRENLILRHNGQMYTFPECVAGVPLEKVDENHPYWEPNWQNVRALIEPQLAKWREKHQAAIDAGPKLEKGGSSKYQIGRQVNRGMKILEFLEEGEISPYQLLSKFYIQSGKGGICSYDTLFRLSESISELAKFKLDIKPVEWMRHRLWEIMQKEGSCFNLPRTIHDFYHDPKLTALRYKHGFKNIGRPSGMKAGRPPPIPTPNTTPRGTKPTIRKRKSMHSVGYSPSNNMNPDQSPLATQIPMAPESPFSTHLQKRPKFLEPIPGPIHDEFHTDDHSDTDSWSGAQISNRDWRVYQVKTRLYTSSTSVTQYWTWLDSEQCFEHQVLKDVEPVCWGLHKDPIDFHVIREEIAEVVWNIEALRVHIVMTKAATLKSKTDGQPRGDVMAAFKRERTMRRFLAFCREIGLRMLKESTEEIDRRWQSMQSEQLTDENEKPIKERST